MHYIKVFIFGLLGAFGALFMELVFSNIYFIFSGQEINLIYFEKITFFLVLVVIIEEIFKYVMFLKSSSPQKKFNFLTVFFFGSGFAAIELGLAYMNAPFLQNSSHLMLSAAGVLLLHIFTTGIIGYFIFFQRENSLFSAMKIIFLSAGLHLAYNLMVIYESSYPAIYSFLAVMFFFLFIFVRVFRARNA